MESPTLQTRMRRTREGQQPTHSHTAFSWHHPSLGLTFHVLSAAWDAAFYRGKAAAPIESSNTSRGEATVPPDPLGVEHQRADFPKE